MDQSARLVPRTIATRHQQGWVLRVALPAAIKQLVLMGFSCVLILPFLFMVSTSLKYTDDLLGFPPSLIPREINIEHYRAIFITGYNFGVRTDHFHWFWFKNTAILVGLNLIGTLFSSSLCAYSFARLRFRGRGVLFIIVLSTMMIPFYVTLIPTYIIWRELNALGTYIPLVVPAFLGGGPFFIFLMRQFIMTLPHEMDDAARIDGCGWFGVYWRIVLPLMKPAMVAIGIFTFLGAYNEFLMPVVILSDPDLYPISVGLRLFGKMMMGQVMIQSVMAASTVVMVPTVVIFLFAQRFFMQGVVISGVKG